jgi:two-component system, chemotaxis family, sensor kinase CheA
MAVDPFVKSILPVFLSETRETCERMTRTLLAIEQEKQTGPILQRSYSSLARNMHNLKGSSSTLGLRDLAQVAHRMEDLLGPLNAAAQPMPKALVDVLLQTFDAFLARIAADIDEQSKDAPDVQEVLLRLEQVAAESLAGNAAVSAPSPVLAPSTTPSSTEVTRPEVAERSPETAAELGSWRVDTQAVLGLSRDIERLREVRLRLEERHRELDRVLPKMIGTALEAETAETLTRLAVADKALVSDTVEVADIVDALDDAVKSICTLPMLTVTEPLNRTVRDLCRQFGKEARLSTVGAEVALDRRLLEALKGALTQLIRNAVDHGIEAPEERESRGKHREGAVVIRVEQVGNLVFIEVSDDGRGLDIERIRAEALRRGIFSAGEAASRSGAELHQLIFRSGFTTRAVASETSGRGVGLDLVYAAVTQLGGQIEVQSISGQGTRMSMTLPAELGSSPVLVVTLGEHQIGLPMTALEAITLAVPDRIRASRSRLQIEFEHDLLPLVDLGGLLGTRPARPPEPGQPLCVLSFQGRRAVLAVDRIAGEHDMVIRPLPEEVRHIPAYQGVSVLSRGEPLLVLRPDWLVSSERFVRAVATAAPHALVVDDSLTARAIHRTVLESGGFIVHTAATAQQALDHVNSVRYDVLVCDIHLSEGIDGLALTAILRSRAATRELPIVIVSALTDEAARQKSLDAGADTFVTKKDCISGRLLTEVNQVMSRHKGAA